MVEERSQTDRYIIFVRLNLYISLRIQSVKSLLIVEGAYKSAVLNYGLFHYRLVII